MFVLEVYVAELALSVNVEPVESVWFGERLGGRLEGCAVQESGKESAVCRGETRRTCSEQS
jgi:hypothetical protein